MFLIKPSYKIESPISRKLVLDAIMQAGATCYKSEPKDASAFVKKIMKLGHESVIEHSSISVRFIIDRGVSHELVRHRLCSFSQESTRYCSYKDQVTFIIPPWINLPEGECDFLVQEGRLYYGANRIGIVPLDTAIYTWLLAISRSSDSYHTLLEHGWTPQQARSVLPNSLKTEIVVTANLREWRHILKLRTSKQAHPQMQEIMIPLSQELHTQLPEVFDAYSP